jgi:hypothetical protein
VVARESVGDGLGEDGLEILLLGKLKLPATLPGSTREGRLVSGESEELEPIEGMVTGARLVVGHASMLGAGGWDVKGRVVVGARILPAIHLTVDLHARLADNSLGHHQLFVSSGDLGVHTHEATVCADVDEGRAGNFEGGDDLADDLLG